MNPFSEFKDLLGSKGQLLLEKFFSDKRELFGTDETDQSLEFEILDYDTDNKGEHISLKWSYDDVLRPHLHHASIEAERVIANRFFSLPDTKEQRAFLMQCLDFLKILSAATDLPANGTKHLVIRNELTLLANRIHATYPSLNINHEMLNPLSEVSLKGSQPTLGLQINQVAPLVGVLVDIEFIENDGEQRDLLKNFLLTPTSIPSSQKIEIACPLQKAAYILSRVVELYKGSITLKVLLGYNIVAQKGKAIKVTSCNSSKSNYIKSPKNFAEIEAIETQLKPFFM